jgi:hypothetical protein
MRGLQQTRTEALVPRRRRDHEGTDLGVVPVGTEQPAHEPDELIGTTSHDRVALEDVDELTPPSLEGSTEMVIEERRGGGEVVGPPQRPEIGVYAGNCQRPMP